MVFNFSKFIMINFIFRHFEANSTVIINSNNFIATNQHYQFVFHVVMILIITDFLIRFIIIIIILDSYFKFVIIHVYFLLPKEISLISIIVHNSINFIITMIIMVIFKNFKRFNKN